MEPDEGRCGIGEDLGAGCRPDGAGHRQQMIVEEGLAIAAGPQVVAERHHAVVEAGRIARRLTIEAQQILEHRPEPRAQDVAPLGEQACEVRAAVFELAAVEGDGEGHLGRQRRHVEMIEKRAEIGIGRLVEDDEAGVHRQRGPVGGGNVDRVGMAAQPRVTLEEGDVMRAGE
ncbi:MAG: putative cyclopropane-fatty-acyl-phospholipid synthase [Xanthobacteraceae bacterium]|nr:MAG: putative cyclopropane-fatty-acyl-phospholipid synthase [Xanthobacteraceae bacterium]